MSTCSLLCHRGSLTDRPSRMPLKRSGHTLRTAAATFLALPDPWTAKLALVRAGIQFPGAGARRRSGSSDYREDRQ